MSTQCINQDDNVGRCFNNSSSSANLSSLILLKAMRIGGGVKAPAPSPSLVSAFLARLTIVMMCLGITSPLAADVFLAGAAPFDSTAGIWVTPFFDTASPEPAKNWSYTRYQAIYRNAGNQLVVGQYDSLLVNTIDYQLEQMEGIGIDFVLTDMTNGVGTGLSFQDLMQSRGVLPVAAAVGGPLQFNQGLTPQQIAAGMQQETDAVWNQLVSKPGYFYKDGKPLMVAYQGYDGGTTVLPLWSDPRFDVQHATGLLDPNNLNLDPVANGYTWDSWWGWHTVEPIPSSLAMTVNPGFDTVHFRGAGGVFQDRLPGGLNYMNQWLAVIQNNPRYVMIPSWNDYNEENHIEPSIPNAGAPGWLDERGFQTPTLYTDITKAYLAFRGGRLLEGFYYRDINHPAVFLVSNGVLVPITTMGDILPGSAIIRLPADTLLNFTPGITGDLNGDGFVGVDDLNIILSNWNQTVPKGDINLGDVAGIGDRFVGVDDLNVVLSNWNAGLPPQEGVIIPEPGSLSLLVLISLGLFPVCRSRNARTTDA